MRDLIKRGAKQFISFSDGRRIDPRFSSKARKIETIELERAIRDYLTYEVNRMIQSTQTLKEPLKEPLESWDFRVCRVLDVFDVQPSKKIFSARNLEILDAPRESYYPYVTRSARNNSG